MDLEPTPNPNSLKITVPGSQFLASGLESFSSAAEASGSPLGRALFDVPGVANVFIVPQFLTLTKRPEVDWDDLLPRVEQVIEDYLSAR